MSWHDSYPGGQKCVSHSSESIVGQPFVPTDQHPGHRTPWPDPVVPRHRRLSVIERIDVEGNPVVPLDSASVRKALDRMLGFGVESIAVCLLHSYRNPEHERRCRDIIAKHAPHVFLTLSSELAPIAGEYERASTAVINAYVAPRVVPYLEGLELKLRELGLRKLLVVQSNGGVASVPQIARRAVAMLLSGFLFWTFRKLF